jgi:hypothetical protein
MIRANKTKAALLAIHAVLVRARYLAYKKEPVERIARILDIAELLPMLILRDEEMTDTFREHIAGLSQLDPGFKLALQKFDSEDL